MTGYWNVFLDGEVGAAKGPSYVTVTDALTREVNAAIDAAATAAGAGYVDLYTAFKGDGARDDTSLLAPDGDHPSASGQQQIAAAVLAVL
jgi:lysophospholipase L1-like esterase